VRQNRLRIRELEKRMEQRFISLERALDIAQAERKQKDNAANEWRAQYQDLTATFARREYLDGQVSTVRAELKPLELAKAALDGKASQSSQYVTTALAVAALVVSLIGLALAGSHGPS